VSVVAELAHLSSSNMPPTKRKKEDADSNSEEESKYVEMTVVQLRKELKKRGLDAGGKKTELISALEASK
jgi:hypothetical protein